MDNFFNQNPQEQDKKGQYSLEKPRYAPLKAGLIGFLVMFLTFNIVGAILEVLIFGFKSHDLGSTPARMLQISNELWFFLLPGLAFSLFVYQDVTKVIRLNRVKLWELAAFSVGLFVLIPALGYLTVLQNFLITILQDKFHWIKATVNYAVSLDKVMQDAYGSLLHPNNILDQILIVAVVAVTPAVCEEVFFRGFLQRSFELRYNKVIGAILAAVFFAFMHMNPFGTVALFILGFYFGYAVYKTDSILVGMLLHFLNNLLSTLVTFFQPGSDVNSSFSSVSWNEFLSALQLTFLLGLFFAFILVLINARYKSRRLPFF
jgi:membrane protease YdiL (CAAX protease family)